MGSASRSLELCPLRFYPPPLIHNALLPPPHRFCPYCRYEYGRGELVEILQLAGFTVDCVDLNSERHGHVVLQARYAMPGTYTPVCERESNRYCNCIVAEPPPL